MSHAPRKSPATRAFRNRSLFGIFTTEVFDTKINTRMNLGLSRPQQCFRLKLAKIWAEIHMLKLLSQCSRCFPSLLLGVTSLTKWAPLIRSFGHEVCAEDKNSLLYALISKGQGKCTLDVSKDVCAFLTLPCSVGV